ncbi:hypothetical protein SC936_01760 [Aggregatibacter actinomycetemcomitans serotype e str. SC936]|nr:hypothetical protein SA3096_00165 [Aggregatibacter actinomycetemcomitans serotype e str. SA3096]KYK82518.1 hypothetical protein SC936_01760 [Aggregatibacter actinomycetemcomitans serotype e str. SC936]
MGKSAVDFRGVFLEITRMLNKIEKGLHKIVQGNK